MAEYDMPVEEQIRILVKEFASFKVTLEERFNSIDSRFDAVDKRLHKIDFRLDEIHDTAKLGLEAVHGLRESTDEKFEAMDKKHDEQIDLLKSVLVQVRKRVEAVERPKARRRRS